MFGCNFFSELKKLPEELCLTQKKGPDAEKKKYLNAIAVRRSSYSAGTVPAAFKFVYPVLRKTSGG
jgi:hypothetical protein